MAGELILSQTRAGKMSGRFGTRWSTMPIRRSNSTMVAGDAAAHNLSLVIARSLRSSLIIDTWFGGHEALGSVVFAPVSSDTVSTSAAQWLV